MNRWNSSFKAKPRAKSMQQSWAERNRNKPKKARAALKPISKKRSALTKPRRDCREFVFERAVGICETKITGVCTGRVEQVHEIIARGQGGSITDPKNCLGTCSMCHSYIHQHPNEARSLGFLK